MSPHKEVFQQIKKKKKKKKKKIFKRFCSPMNKNVDILELQILENSVFCVT